MFLKQRNAYKYVSRDDEDQRSFKMGRDSIPQKILKVLFARSGNQCAFPGCVATIFDPNANVVYGEVCHIEGVEPGAARHNPLRDAETLNDYDNLILLCERHHKLIDSDSNKYTVPFLWEIKARHEQQGPIEITPFETKCADLMIQHLGMHVSSDTRVYNGSTHIEATGNATQHIVINNVRGSGRRKSVASVPTVGTVGTDAAKRAYVAHLYDRLFKFTSAIPKYSNGRAGATIARKIRERFGATWTNVPLERYDEFVAYLKAEIDKTPIGRKNTLRGDRNYSSYEEFISGGTTT